jgi:hypothetical protein
MSKRHKGFPSETQVKRGVRIVHGDKELLEKVNSGCPGCPFLSIVMIIHNEQQSTARSCGRQCEKLARLEKGSLTATPGLSERYPQESLMPRKLRQETGRQGFLLFGHENRFLRPAGDRAPLGISKEVSVLLSAFFLYGGANKARHERWNAVRAPIGSATT